HIDSTYLHPRYKPNCKRPNLSALPASPVGIKKREGKRRRQRNATLEKEQEKTRTMSSSTETPSPPDRCPPPLSSPASDSADSLDIEDVPRKFFRSYLSLTEKMGEGSNMNERDMRKFRREETERIRREVQADRGYDGDVETEDILLSDDGSDADHAEVERGHDGDIEIGDVPSRSHKVKGRDCGNNGLIKREAQTQREYDGDSEMKDVPPGPSHGVEGTLGNNGFGKSNLETPKEQTEPQGEKKESKKRVRFSEEAGDDEEQVEYEREHKRRKSGEGSMHSSQ
ncbi:hypothetical protein QBC32DRAFT_387623, partial [Pseudoneurospora amorphoporcata]